MSKTEVIKLKEVVFIIKAIEAYIEISKHNINHLEQKIIHIEDELTNIRKEVLNRSKKDLSYLINLKYKYKNLYSEIKLQKSRSKTEVIELDKVVENQVNI